MKQKHAISEANVMLDIRRYPPARKWSVLLLVIFAWLGIIGYFGPKFGLDQYDAAFWIILNSGWALIPSIVLKLDVYEELQRLLQGRRMKNNQPWIF
jgi:hypothetical protein